MTSTAMKRNNELLSTTTYPTTSMSWGDVVASTVQQV